MYLWSAKSPRTEGKISATKPWVSSAHILHSPQAERANLKWRSFWPDWFEGSFTSLRTHLELARFSAKWQDNLHKYWHHKNICILWCSQASTTVNQIFLQNTSTRMFPRAKHWSLFQMRRDTVEPKNVLVVRDPLAGNCSTWKSRLRFMTTGKFSWSFVLAPVFSPFCFSCSCGYL